MYLYKHRKLNRGSSESRHRSHPTEVPYTSKKYRFLQSVGWREAREGERDTDTSVRVRRYK